MTANLIVTITQNTVIQGGGGPGLSLLDWGGRLHTTLKNVSITDTAQAGDPLGNSGWYNAPIVLNAGWGPKPTKSHPSAGFAPWAPTYGNLTLCDVRVRYDAVAPPPTRCEAAEAALCGNVSRQQGKARPGGGLECRACAGDHAVELTTAGCTDAAIADFCRGGGEKPPQSVPSPWLIMAAPESSVLVDVRAVGAGVRVETKTPQQVCQTTIIGATNRSGISTHADCVPDSFLS